MAASATPVPVASDAPTAPSPPLAVALLNYSRGKKPICFSAGFLEALQRETGWPVQLAFAQVDLATGDLSPYPLVILAGEYAFELTPAEREQLKKYLAGGGFLLASTGCSMRAWSKSFLAEARQIWPDMQWRDFPIDHPLLRNGVFALHEVSTLMPTDQPALQGGWQGERLQVLFSPVGLTDSDAAGSNCCCCGGNEIRNTRQVNANILYYAIKQREAKNQIK